MADEHIINTTPPHDSNAERNVIGSMLSMPVRWKTKAVPQIMAVSMSKALPSIFLSLIQALRDLWNRFFGDQQVLIKTATE